ncbi:hypothetical protein C9374_001709 [Naegleria lovaniensis]|uniref:Non-specific serine/threonine protein kinase n=1 Tax=Naegleria lovaniensis TaxID=51637 RepID=A0AA88GUQ6_NAELO|nr:uncharacterized protein C9374_001709 [Naegleria lovaniensis]KAG2387377.1 hypothetical protein C9374_001709 [Naegleria lovaniensis]
MSQDVESSIATIIETPSSAAQQEIENLASKRNVLDLPSSINSESISLATQKIFNELLIDSNSKQFDIKYVALIKNNYLEFIQYFIQQVQNSKSNQQDILFGLGMLAIICLLLCVESINSKNFTDKIAIETINNSLSERKRNVDIQFFVTVLTTIQQQLQAKNNYLLVYDEFLSLLLQHAKDDSLLVFDQATVQYAYQYIIKECQRFLTTLDSISNLFLVLDILDTMSSLSKIDTNSVINYITFAMQTSFKDVIDILVGWFLDKNTLHKQKLRIGESLANMPSSLWEGKHLDFTSNLIQKFISDMNSLNDERQFQTFVMCLRFVCVSLSPPTFFQILNRNKTILALLFDTLFLGSLTKFSDKKKQLWRSILECIITFTEKISIQRKSSDQNIVKNVETDIAENTLGYIEGFLSNSCDDIPSEFFSFVLTVLNNLESVLSKPMIKIFINEVLRFACKQITIDAYLYLELARIFDMLFNTLLKKSTLEVLKWTENNDFNRLFVFGMMAFSMDKGNDHIYSDLLNGHENWMEDMLQSDEQTFIEMLKKFRNNFDKFKGKVSSELVLEIVLQLLNRNMVSQHVQRELLLWLHLIYQSETTLPTDNAVDTLRSILDSDSSIENKLAVLRVVVECLEKVDTDKYSLNGTTQLLGCFFKCLESNSEVIFSESVESIRKCGHILVDQTVTSEFTWFKYYSSRQSEGLPDGTTLSNDFERLFSSLESSTIEDPYVYKSVPNAVLYCIVNRLKTPFGNAMPTFEEFEKLLIKHPDSEVLQYFISELQRQVNALIYSHAFSSLFHSQVVTFFTSNLKVCNDWFTRLQSQMSGRIVYNGLKSLLSEKEKLERVETLLIAICTTLCEEYDDQEMLNGLQTVIETDFQKHPSFLQVVKGFIHETQGRFEEALRYYEEIPSFFSERNRTKIMDRILMCKYYLKTDESFELFQLASQCSYSPSMTSYIEMAEQQKAGVDLRITNFSNRHDDLILSKLTLTEEVNHRQYIKRYLHQNVAPFATNLIPAHNLEKVKISPKYGIIIYADQKKADTTLLKYHLDRCNMHTARSLVERLGIEEEEKAMLKLDELYNEDRNQAIVNLANKLSRSSNKQLLISQRAPSKLYYWIDQNQHSLGKDTLAQICSSLGIHTSGNDRNVIPTILNTIVSISELLSPSSHKDHLHMALEFLEKYDTENKNRLQMYRNILQYQVNLSRLEVTKIVAKLLNDLKCFDDEEFNRFVEDIDYRIWLPFIPQIFSVFTEYYAHAKSIILKLGKHRLQSIIYPSVVRYLDHAKNSTDIIGELRKINVDMVNSVISFVTECKRMTHTWHDLWLQTLAGCRKYLTKTGVKSQKFRILLEQTYNVTMNALPESRVEHLFQVQYQSVLQMIYQSLIELSNRTDDVSDLELDIVKHKLSDLSHQISRGSIFREFQMEDVVPKLLNPEILRNIPIPGFHLHSSEDSLVTVESVNSKVKVLGSKTKPKKIILIGNNGKSYTFLLKGKEDLRLDQRMQQFIRASNMILKYNNSDPLLRNRTYDVTPLGKNCGLIEWIEDTQTIFNLYRKKDSVYKPMDHYYKCLLPILKSENITKQPYPTSVLKKVFTKCKATLDKEPGINPADTLQRHVLFNPTQTSINSSFESQRNFIISTACMSAIGYVVGLGDRHLDNILIDSFTSEVIHIDYQICFNQGLNLPVPEIVPFRLTPCIQMAIGDSVMKSKFYSVCEQTLMSLHKEKNLLLELLMTFISDPLIDQTSDQQIHSIFDKQLDALFLEQVIEKKEDIVSEFKAFMEGISLLDVFEEVRVSEQTRIEEYCLIIENEKILQQEKTSIDVSSFNSIESAKDKLDTEKLRVAAEKHVVSASLENLLKKFSDESAQHFNLFNTVKNREFTLAYMGISITKPEPLLHNILPYLSTDSTEYFQKQQEVEDKQVRLKMCVSEMVSSLREIQGMYNRYSDMEYIAHDMKYVISNVLHQLLICKDPSQLEPIVRSICVPLPELLNSITTLDNELAKLDKDLQFLTNQQFSIPMVSYSHQIVDVVSLLNQIIIEAIDSSRSMMPSESSVYDVSDWCGFRNLLRIEACIVFCHDNGLSSANQIPTKDQLVLLSTGIANITSTVKQFLENFVFVIIPEFLTALSQSDSVIKLLRIIMDLFESDMSIKDKMMAYQVHLSNPSSANLLCLAMDTQFTQLETPFKELSLIPNVSDLFFSTKLDTLHDIFSELLNYDPSYNQSIYNIINIIKDHVDTFVEKVTIPTLIETLQQWNIYRSDVSNEIRSNEALMHQIKKLTLDFEEFGNRVAQRIIIPRQSICRSKLQTLMWNNQFSSHVTLKNQSIIHWKESILDNLENSLRRTSLARDDLVHTLQELQNLEQNKYLTICKPYLNESQFNGLLTNISTRNANMENMMKQLQTEIVFGKSVLYLEKKDRQVPFDTADLGSIYGSECYNAIKNWQSLFEKEILYQKEYQDLIHQKERFEELEHEIEALHTTLKDPDLVEVQSNQMHYSDLIRSKFIAPYKQLASKAAISYMNLISQLVSVLQSMIELSSFHKAFRQALQQFEAKLTAHYELVNQYFVDCNDSLEFKKESMDSLFHYQHHKKLISRTNELKQSVNDIFDYTIDQFNEISKQIEEQSYIENIDDDIMPQQQKNSNNNYDGPFIVQLVEQRLNEADSNEKVRNIIAKQMEQATSEENLSKMYKGWIPWL